MPTLDLSKQLNCSKPDKSVKHSSSKPDDLLEILNAGKWGVGEFVGTRELPNKKSKLPTISELIKTIQQSYANYLVKSLNLGDRSVCNVISTYVAIALKQKKIPYTTVAKHADNYSKFDIERSIFHEHVRAWTNKGIMIIDPTIGQFFFDMYYKPGYPSGTINEQGNYLKGETKRIFVGTYDQLVDGYSKNLDKLNFKLRSYNRYLEDVKGIKDRRNRAIIIVTELYGGPNAIGDTADKTIGPYIHGGISNVAFDEKAIKEWKNKKETIYCAVGGFNSRP